MRSVYTASTEGQVSCVANTPKTVLGIEAPSNFGIDLLSFWIDFDGVDSTQKPVLVEICTATFATNAPGTNSTAATVQRQAGKLANTGFSAAKTWTAEPTVLTVIDSFALDPNKGVFRYEWPFGENPDFDLADGFAIRVTVPTGGATVNVRAGVRIART